MLDTKSKAIQQIKIEDIALSNTTSFESNTLKHYLFDKTAIRAGSNYTKLYQLQLHLIFYFNYNYSHNCQNQLQLQLHCFNFNYIMQNQVYLAFVNYVFLHVLLNFNILYTIDKQI